jgi:hypothetical protein
VLRRKRIPPEHEAAFAAFQESLASVERAKEHLVSAVPSSRLPGRPLADALGDYEDGLASAREAMPGWRGSEVEAEWESCSKALAEAIDAARRFRLETPELPFDALMFALQDLMVPLEAFELAAIRWRRLRR